MNLVEKGLNERSTAPLFGPGGPSVLADEG
jgi:hypothetical protein